METSAAVALTIGLVAGSAFVATAQEPGSEAAGCVFPAAAELENASVPAGFCAWRWARDLDRPRGISVDDNGNVLILEQAAQSVVLLHDDDGNGVSGPDERVTLASAPGLNHGLALQGERLYASSASTVYGWDYLGDRVPLGEPDVVISGIPSGGSHQTRTLLFDADYLYISVGSAGNVDRDSSRARIRRFPIDDLNGPTIDFAEGEVFADGLRNEVGLGLDLSDRVWGVENGRDGLRRRDFDPSDIHEDNPAEELNLFAEPGRFYGYPYCWSEFSLPRGQGLGAGAQWADPQSMDDGTHDDAWCQDPANVVPPVTALQAHSAPLDVLFYAGGSFPDEYVGDALVTFHGSWNRSEPTGYKVVRIPFDSDGMPADEPESLLEYAGAGDLGSGWRHRPVGLAVTPGGRLLVTSDSSRSILAVDYAP